MNDFNSSEGANAVVSSGAFQYGSQDTQQFNIQGIRKYTINLRANRVSGEFIPAIEGDYLYISKLDIPVNISLIRTDGGHDVLSREGDEYTGSFKGIWISHWDTSAIPGSTPLMMTILVGSGQTQRNSSNNPQSSRLGLPFLAAFTTPGVNGLTRIAFPVPDGANRIEELVYSDTLTLTASKVSDVVAGIQFLDNSAQAVVSPSLTVNGVAYGGVNGVYGYKCDQVDITPATFVYGFGFRANGIRIPSTARQIRATIRVGVGNNLVSASGVFNSVGYSNALCFVS